MEKLVFNSALNNSSLKNSEMRKRPSLNTSAVASSSLALASPSTLGLGDIFLSDNMGKPWGVPTAKTWPPFTLNYTDPRWFCKEGKPWATQSTSTKPKAAGEKRQPLSIWVTIPTASSVLGAGQRSPVPKASRACAGIALTYWRGFDRAGTSTSGNPLIVPAQTAAGSGARASGSAILARQNERESASESGRAQKDQAVRWPCRRNGIFQPCIYKGLQQRFSPIRPAGRFDDFWAQNVYIQGGAA